jgi:hypothetical protein
MTGQNNKLPLFCSRMLEPGSIQTDAWGAWEMYAFPPIPLLPKVLGKIRMDKALTILIAHMWPRQLWYPQLLFLACECPRVLPLIPKMLSQVLADQGTLYHSGTTTLRLVAWKLSWDSSKTRDCHVELLTSCSQPGSLPHGR